MKHKTRLVCWLVFTAAVVVFGFYGGWSTFDCVALSLAVVYGCVLLFSVLGEGPLLKRIAAMSPDEREEFMAKFNEEERQKLSAKLRDHLEH